MVWGERIDGEKELSWTRQKQPQNTPPAPDSDLSTMAALPAQASQGQQGWSAGWRLVRVPSLRAKGKQEEFHAADVGESSGRQRPSQP